MSDKWALLDLTPANHEAGVALICGQLMSGTWSEGAVTLDI
jgi:hypothetical protein